MTNKHRPAAWEMREQLLLLADQARMTSGGGTLREAYLEELGNWFDRGIQLTQATAWAAATQQLEKALLRGTDPRSIRNPYLEEDNDAA